MSTDNKLRLFEGKEALFIYNSLIQDEMATKEKGIMIFKDTFEYLMDGDLTGEQFAELMKLVYQLRWGDGVDDSKIKDKEVKLIWKTLKHTVQKSKTNAKQYQKNNADIKPNNEFENESPNKIPSVQFEAVHSEEQFNKDVEVAVNQIIEVGIKKEQDLFDNVLENVSNDISTKYNKPFNDIKKLLYETAKEKHRRNKELKEVS